MTLPITCIKKRKNPKKNIYTFIWNYIQFIFIIKVALYYKKTVSLINFRLSATGIMSYSMSTLPTLGPLTTSTS